MGHWSKKATKTCPELPRLDGKRVLITGGAAGVGEFISRGLIERGAQVTSMARGQSKGTGELTDVRSLQVDLAEPQSIVAGVEQLGDTPFDLLICNAGLTVAEAQLTQIDVEKTFAVNVLGHHILYRLLIEKGLFSQDARIVMTTGDIYIMEDSCSINIPFDTSSKTYARSKLGNMWQVSELTKRYPALHAIAVHPGVIASGFAGSKEGFFAKVRDKLLISEQAGAQASLIAATQNIPKGAYWNNVLGIVNLTNDDPALDHENAARLWDELETVTTPYIE